MARKQRVRFYKGDQKPAKGLKKKLTYTIEMIKEKRKILWGVMEEPTGNCVAKFFFEEDAKKLADFQNKHHVWQVNGGIPKFLWNYHAV